MGMTPHIFADEIAWYTIVNIERSTGGKTTATFFRWVSVEQSRDEFAGQPWLRELEPCRVVAAAN
jgi:hypothetical protein